jgi:hypothetical protein
MTPLNKVTKQVLQQMQSFNEYNEQANLNGHSVDTKQNILGNLRNDASQIEDFPENSDGDMEKLQQMFNKLLAAGKINR